MTRNRALARLGQRVLLVLSVATFGIASAQDPKQLALDVLSGTSADMESAHECSPSLQAQNAILCVRYPYDLMLLKWEITGLPLLNEELEVHPAGDDALWVIAVAIGGEEVIQIHFIGGYLVVTAD